MVRYPAPITSDVVWPVFTRAEALDAGVRPDRLRRGDLVRLRRGLYARRGVNYREADIIAALCRNDPEVAAVGLSAARLLSIPLTAALEQWHPRTPVHMAVPGRRGRSDPIVTWHAFNIAPTEVRPLTYRLRGTGDSCSMAATSHARTWRDLAPHLTHVELVAAGDHLVRRPHAWSENRRDPWCTPARLLEVCTGQHARALRHALADVRIGADSPMETRLRLAFIAAGLPEPQINQPLVGDDGVERHCPDFQWRDFGICVEYEGQTHNDPDQVARDIRRARAVKDAGCIEIRLAKGDLHPNCSGAVQIVRAALNEQGWRPSS